MDFFRVAAAQKDFPPILQHTGFGSELADEFHIDDQASGYGEERISQFVQDIRLCHTDLNDHSVLQVYIIVMGIALCVLDFIRK